MENPSRLKMGRGFCACPFFCVTGKNTFASPREVLGSGEGGRDPPITIKRGRMEPQNYHQARADGTPQLPSSEGGWTPPQLPSSEGGWDPPITINRGRMDPSPPKLPSTRPQEEAPRCPHGFAPRARRGRRASRRDRDKSGSPCPPPRAPGSFFKSTALLPRELRALPTRKKRALEALTRDPRLLSQQNYARSLASWSRSALSQPN